MNTILNSQRRYSRKAWSQLALQNYSTYPTDCSTSTALSQNESRRLAPSSGWRHCIYIELLWSAWSYGCFRLHSLPEIPCPHQSNMPDHHNLGNQFRRSQTLFSSDLFINFGSFLAVFLAPFCHYHHFLSQTLASINLNLSSIFTSPFSEPRPPKTHRRRIFRSA